MGSLFKSRRGAPPPVAQPAPPVQLHPVQRALLALLQQLTSTVPQMAADPELELDLVTRGLLGKFPLLNSMGQALIHKMPPSACDKLVHTLNAYNAQLCHECGIEPQRVTDDIRQPNPAPHRSLNGGGDDGQRQDDSGT